MHDNRPTSEDRVRRFLNELLPARRHLATAPLTIEAWEVPGEPVPFAEAKAQDYRPISVGDRWGRPWSTLWLHVTGTVPPTGASTRSATSSSSWTCPSRTCPASRPRR